MIPPSSSQSGPSAGNFLATIDRILYPITLGFTMVILGFEIYEFAQGGYYRPRFPIGDVYLTLLTAYAAQREGAKWLGADEALMRLRRGELFVGIWFAVYLLMWAMANVSMRWTLPVELKTIALGVLAVFAGTGISAGLRERSTRTTDAASTQDDSDRRVQILRLVNEKGPISAEDVAQNLGLPHASVWRLLERLEKEGRIAQDPSADRRDRLYRIKT